MYFYSFWTTLCSRKDWLGLEDGLQFWAAISSNLNLGGPNDGGVFEDPGGSVKGGTTSLGGKTNGKWGNGTGDEAMTFPGFDWSIWENI